MLTLVYRPRSRKLLPWVEFNALTGMSWSVAKMKFESLHPPHAQITSESCVNVNGRTFCESTPLSVYVRRTGRSFDAVMRIVHGPSALMLTPVYRPRSRKLEPCVTPSAFTGISWSVEKMKFDSPQPGHDHATSASCLRTKGRTFWLSLPRSTTAHRFQLARPEQ
jgi:hypothetical protein